MNTLKVHGLPSCLILALSFTTCAVAQNEVHSASQSDQFDEVLVTATRLNRPQQDIAGTVTHISAEEIEQGINNDLADIARYQPGLSMNTAARGGNQGYSIRGIGGNRVLTLIDGIRSADIYAAGPSSYGKDAFEVEDLKAIEIIRGPASVLYGADAMGGAVILLSKDPEDYLLDDQGQYFGLRTSASSADQQYKIGLTSAARFGDFGTLAQLTQRHYSELETYGDINRNPQDGESTAILLKGVWSADDQHRLELGLEANKEEIQYDLITDLSGSVTSSLGSDQSDRYRISAQHLWKTSLTIANQVETQLYWQSTDAVQHTEQLRTSYSFINPMDFTTYGGTQAQRLTDFEFNQSTTGASIGLTKSIAGDSLEQTMVYGINYEQTRSERPRNRCETSLSSAVVTCDIAAYPFAEPESFPNKTFPDTTTTRSGLYWQNEMRIGDGRLSLIPGLRYDQYRMQVSRAGLQDLSSLGFEVSNIEENHFTANLGLIYDLSENSTLFLQYAEGFRPPNFDESNQAFVNLGFGYASVPNPDLKPETSKGVELGVKNNFANGTLNFALFNNDYQDFIDSSFVGTNGAISLFQDQNIAEVHIRGMEVDANYRIQENWAVSGSIAYAKGDNEIANTPLDSIEPLTGVIGLQYQAENWGIESLITLVGNKDRVSSDSQVTASSYGVLDLIGHYNLSESAKLRFGIFNLTDEEYASWSNIQGLSAEALDDIARSTESGLNFRTSLSLNF